MTTRRPWTEPENALLRAMYPHCHTGDIAEWVGRTQGQCYQHAAALGLRKSAEYLASDTACRVSRSRRTPGMIANQFKPGEPSWSKGTKGRVGVQDGCRATQFKKGRLPSEARNYVPVGSHRFNADGYWERKISDDPNVYPARRWESVARIVWKEAHGEIPAGHIVRLKPGQHTSMLHEITIDRLECITRVENMRRNSYHTNYPPEVARLIQLRGALNRQINERQKATA